MSSTTHGIGDVLYDFSELPSYMHWPIKYELSDWPDSIYERSDEEPVRTALIEYLKAYTADKVAIHEHDAFDCAPWDYKTNDMNILRAHWAKTGDLRSLCTQTRRHRKKLWFALLDLLGETYDLSDEDAENDY